MKKSKSKRPKASKNNGNSGSQFSIRDPLTGQMISSDAVNDGLFARQFPIPYSPYGSAQYEVETSNRKIVFTARHDGTDRFKVERAVFTGSFTTDRKGNVQGTATTFSAFEVQSTPTTLMETAQSYTLRNGSPINNLLIRQGDIASATYFFSNSADTTVATSFGYPGTPLYNDRNSLAGLPDTGFFQEGWWQNPFATNLI